MRAQLGLSGTYTVVSGRSAASARTNTSQALKRPSTSRCSRARRSDRARHRRQQPHKAQWRHASQPRRQAKRSSARERAEKDRIRGRASAAPSLHLPALPAPSQGAQADRQEHRGAAVASPSRARSRPAHEARRRHRIARHIDIHQTVAPFIKVRRVDADGVRRCSHGDEPSAGREDRRLV